MKQMAIWGLLALWAVLMVLSALQWQADPTGDGFTRGMNRLTGFLKYQGIGFLIGLVLLALRPWARGGVERRLLWVPLLAAGALALGMAGLVLYAVMTGA